MWEISKQCITFGLAKTYVIYMTCVNSFHKFSDIILCLGCKKGMIILKKTIFSFAATFLY